MFLSHQGLLSLSLTLFLSKKNIFKKRKEEEEEVEEEEVDWAK